jgi:hypothetical protein
MYALPKETVEKIVSTYIDSLKPRIDILLAMLFGSYAKGNYSFGSDVDILIVAEHLPKDLSKRISLLMDSEVGCEIQPFGYTKKEFDKMLKERHPLALEVLKTGKIVYLKPGYKVGKDPKRLDFEGK